MQISLSYQSSPTWCLAKYKVDWQREVHVAVKTGPRKNKVGNVWTVRIEIWGFWNREEVKGKWMFTSLSLGAMKEVAQAEVDCKTWTYQYGLQLLFDCKHLWFGVPPRAGLDLTACVFSSFRQKHKINTKNYWKYKKRSCVRLRLGDKHHLRKSADRKAQIRKAFFPLTGPICALRFDFHWHDHKPILTVPVWAECKHFLLPAHCNCEALKWSPSPSLQNKSVHLPTQPSCSVKTRGFSGPTWRQSVHVGPVWSETHVHSPVVGWQPVLPALLQGQSRHSRPSRLYWKLPQETAEKMFERKRV